MIPRSTILLATMLSLLTSACVTRRAADFLTLPRRATDAAHWEKESHLKPRRFEVKARDGVVLSALVIEAAPQRPKLGTAYLFHGYGNTKEQMLPTAKRLSAEGFRCVAWDFLVSEVSKPRPVLGRPGSWTLFPECRSPLPPVARRLAPERSASKSSQGPIMKTSPLPAASRLGALA